MARKTRTKQNKNKLLYLVSLIKTKDMVHNVLEGRMVSIKGYLKFKTNTNIDVMKIDN